MRKFYCLIFCTALMLAGCEEGIGNDDDGKGGDTELVLSNDTKTEVTVKADENGEGQVIKFTAAAAWNATVKDVTSSKADTENNVDWLKLSSYSGEAGNVSLTLSISKNFTGVNRKAEIIIQCGDATIKITIEQVAENADGTVTRQVEYITNRCEFNSEKVNNPDAVTVSEETMKYSYDDKGRVVKIASADFDENDYSYETIYDYTIVDEIQVISREYSDSGTNEEKYIVNLNDKGNAVKVRKFDSYENKYLDKSVISYYDDGRLKQAMMYGGYSPEKGTQYNFTYENGYLTKITETGYDENIINFDIPTFYPNKYPNNNIIDMITFYSVYEDWELGNESISMLSTIGRLGKTGDYFLERRKRDQLEDNFPLETSHEKPGTVIREVKYKNTDFNNYDDIFSCEYDKDDNLTKVTITTGFDINEISYQIVVSDKVAEEHDGIKIYFCEIENYSKNKIGSDVDTVTYTLSYK